MKVILLPKKIAQRKTVLRKKMQKRTNSNFTDYKNLYCNKVFYFLTAVVKAFVMLMVFGSIAMTAKASDNDKNINQQQSQAKQAASPIEIKGVTGELLINIEIYLGIESAQLPLSPLGFPRSINYIKQKTQQALRSFGFYQPLIVLTGDHSQWYLNIKPGPPVVWTNQQIELTGQAQQLAEFTQLLSKHPFTHGKTMHHGVYTDFKNKLQTAALDYGFFDFKFIQSQLLVDEEKLEAQVKWQIDSGNRYTISELTLQGTTLSLDFLSRYLSVEQGQYYHRSEVVKSHQKLNRSGFFKSVLLDQTIDQSLNQVALKFELTELEKYQLKTKLGFGTDSGANFGLDWQDRRVNKDGHRYSMGLNSNQIKNAVFAQYTIPLEDIKDEWINRVSFEEINDELAKTNIATYQSSLFFQLDQHWSSQWTLNLATEEVRENANIARQLDYLVPSFKLEYSSVVDPFTAQQGWRWQQDIRFANKALTDPDFDFVQIEQQLKSIWSLTDNWRIIAKTKAGYTQMEDDAFNQFMPTQYRFFAGGDASVRGYKRQTLSPTDPLGVALGGKHVLSYSIETDYRFADDFRWAVFFDSGNSFNHWDNIKLRDSVGVGLRWVTPVGSIRLDYAHALDEQKNWRWHITIGPDL
jgi:translocation and assembly module TamA